MSKYTTELRFICEAKAGLTESVGYDDIASTIAAARESIFDFTYPIFDNEYKSVLETKILKHFYTREIAEETYGLWKLRLDSKMNEIMPYYNKLYESELIEFDPMSDTDVTTDSNRSNIGSENVNNSNTLTISGTVKDDKTGQDVESMSGDVTDNINKDTTDSGNQINNTHTTDSNVVKNDHWDYYSDTPQGTVGNLANLSYLTNARHITDDGTGTTDTTDGTNLTTFGKNVHEEGESNKREYDTAKTNIYGNSNTKTYDKVDGNVGTSTKVSNDLNEYLEHVTGKRWADSYSELLMKYRNTFLNIDLLVLDELEELFLQIW